MRRVADYYELPREARWIGSAEEVGGHSLELEQIGRVLYMHLRERYPINRVPPDLASRIDELIVRLIEDEKEIRRFILDVGNDLAVAAAIRGND